MLDINLLGAARISTKIIKGQMSSAEAAFKFFDISA